MLLPNMLETNMPIKLGVYAKYLMGENGSHICIYVPYQINAISQATRHTIDIFDIYH